MCSSSKNTWQVRLVLDMVNGSGKGGRSKVVWTATAGSDVNSLLRTWTCTVTSQKHTASEKVMWWSHDPKPHLKSELCATIQFIHFHAGWSQCRGIPQNVHNEFLVRHVAPKLRLVKLLPEEINVTWAIDNGLEVNWERYYEKRRMVTLGCTQYTGISTCTH